MQARRGVTDPTPTNTPGHTTTVDDMRAHNEHVTVRDLVLAGGVRRMTVKEMFGEC